MWMLRSKGTDIPGSCQGILLEGLTCPRQEMVQSEVRNLYIPQMNPRVESGTYHLPLIQTVVDEFPGKEGRWICSRDEGTGATWLNQQAASSITNL